MCARTTTLPPGRGERAERRALVSVGAQFFVNGAVSSSFIPRLPEIRDRLGVSLPGIGMLLTVASLGGLLGSAVVGRVVARLGTRRSMILGGLVLVSVLPVVGFATAPWVFLMAAIALQATDVIVDVAMNLQGSWLSNARHTPVMNRLHGLWSVGSVVGGFGATRATAAGVSLQVHLVVVAGVLLATMAFVAPGLLPTDRTAAAAGGQSPAGRAGAGLLAVFAVLGATALVIEVITSDWAPFRFTEDFGVVEGTAGLGYVAFTTGMVVGRLGGDSALGRLGADRLLRLALGLAVAGVSTATLAPNRFVALAGFHVAGLGIAVLFPRIYDAAAQAPGRPGAALGAMTAGQRLGLFVAPVTVGALAGTSAIPVGAAMAAVTLPCAAALAVLVPRVGHRAHPRVVEGSAPPYHAAG